jgi:hypothetical protein
MKAVHVVLATTLALGCASLRTSDGARALQRLPTRVEVRSNNQSAVDVYLLCGDRDALWLGVVGAKGGEVFEIPAALRRCARGLNFFLVRRDFNRGYWVGPLFVSVGSHVELVIERYPGLSTASSRRESP